MAVPRYKGMYYQWGYSMSLYLILLQCGSKTNSGNMVIFNLYFFLWNFANFEFFIVKGTVSLISSDPPYNAMAMPDLQKYPKKLCQIEIS